MIVDTYREEPSLVIGNLLRYLYSNCLWKITPFPEGTSWQILAW